MFRWLKGGKKGKTKSSKGDSYGFNNKSNSTSTNYGFRERKKDNLDSSVHIYDEIRELPEISFSRQFTLLPDETNIGNNVEGPYLVVPILPARKTSDRNDHQKQSLDSLKSLMKSESKQRVYNEPWDIPKDQEITKDEASIPHPAFRDSESSYTCSSVSIRTDSSRTNGSDTGCEYDMSTSTESDVSSEYKELITKMQNNLALKHQILKMIKESESDDSDETSTKRKSKKTSSSSLDSCEFTRSRDIFDKEDTESEYSSGFDEVEINGNNIIPPLASAASRPLKHTVPCFDDICKTEKYSENLKELYIPPKRTGSAQSKASSSSAKRLSWNSSIPPLVPKPTKVYNSQRTGSYASSNRLLGDLINMNHNMQTMKF